MSSNIDFESLKPLFVDLRAIRFDENEKQSRAENLIDVLEIVAVAAGLKLTHLNGHGFRSDQLHADLQGVATAHGLHTVRTTPCLPYHPRASNLPLEIKNWHRTDAEDRQRVAPDVLWIYKDPAAPAAIQKALRGEVGGDAVLGYPKCCVTYHSEFGIRMNELYYGALKKKYPGEDVTALMARMQANEEIEIAGPTPKMTALESARQFPYVQFHACPNCLQKAGTPGSKVNATMRELAFGLDPAFGAAIWRAHHADHRLPMPALNADCPCGSGVKLKRCCGA
jgi:hypothetical protein